MIKILDARFVTTAVAAEGYPKAERPEIAFVGRSNVGKSSMINVMAGRRKLVRVSNTPGRTRTLNFFDIDLEHAGTRQGIRFVDLPGYGFAKAPKAERAQWQKMITQYLEKRDVLQIVVSIVDAEVGPSPEDMQTLDYLSEHARRVLVVATKIDRIPKARRKPRLKQIQTELALPDGVLVPFSATETIGTDEIWAILLEVLAKDGRPA